MQNGLGGIFKHNKSSLKFRINLHLNNLQKHPASSFHYPSTNDLFCIGWIWQKPKLGQSHVNTSQKGQEGGNRMADVVFLSENETTEGVSSRTVHQHELNAKCGKLNDIPNGNKLQWIEWKVDKVVFTVVIGGTFKWAERIIETVGVEGFSVGSCTNDCI